MRLEDLQVGDRFEVWHGSQLQWRGLIGHPELGPTHVIVEPDDAVWSIVDFQADCDLGGLRIEKAAEGSLTVDQA